MTLDELKNFEDDVANHRQLPKDVLDNLFAIVRTTLEIPIVEAQAPVVKKPRSKAAE